jgi:hypothetical protein
MILKDVLKTDVRIIVLPKLDQFFCMVEEWSKQKKMPKLVEVIFSKILNEERL